MKTSLSEEVVRGPFARLRTANLAFAERYPGESGKRQPVHTVYGGGHLFKADSAAKLGGLALRTLREYAPDHVTFARVLGLPGSETLTAPSKTEPDAANRADRLARDIHRRVVDKLGREPVEDYRIDFEDGYGNRSDQEEDGHAAQAATEVARGMAAGTLPPFLGVRVKPFTEEMRERSVRTADIFVSTLVERSGRKLPDGFCITLPKVQIPEQVAAFAEVLGLLESKVGLASGTLKVELMIETTQAIVDSSGAVTIPKLLAAARGRCVACHFGTYDYTATCSIIAAHQRMTHPACDFAKHAMQVSLSGTGVWTSDGATTIMPIAPHRASADGPLSPAQIEENRAAVHRAWKLAYDNVMHSLVHGFYQGWDLHPGQLPIRYAAVYAFFLDAMETQASRLGSFVEKAGQATLHGDTFDDAATGQGLLNYFLRAIGCGAMTESEAAAMSGVSHEELLTRSFLAILKRRRASATAT